MPKTEKEKLIGQQDGVATHTDTAPTADNAQSAGQEAYQATKETVDADTSVLPTKYEFDQSKTAQQNMEQLSAQGSTAAQMLKKGLQIKQDAAPFDKKKARIAGRIMERSSSDYKRLPIKDAIRFMREDMARDVQELQYITTQQEKTQARMDGRLSDYTDWLNSQVNALGLKVDSEQQDFSNKIALEQLALQKAAAARSGSGSSPKVQDDVTGLAQLVVGGQLSIDDIDNDLQAAVANMLPGIVAQQAGANQGMSLTPGAAQSAYADWLNQPDTSTDEYIYEQYGQSVNAGMTYEDALTKYPGVPVGVHDRTYQKGSFAPDNEKKSAEDRLVEEL